MRLTYTVVPEDLGLVTILGSQPKTTINFCCDAPLEWRFAIGHRFNLPDKKSSNRY